MRYASSYFPQLHEYAIQLIKEGKAFVCSLSFEEAREYRGTLTTPGKNSPDRDRPIEENLRLFEEMKAGKHPEGSLTLRLKIDMASPIMNLRDPVIYRIKYYCSYIVDSKSRFEVISMWYDACCGRFARNSPNA